MTATSSPVSVGVISKHHVGNMQYKYRVLISPLRSAGSSNPSVTLSPPRSLCPAAPQLRQPAARLLPAVSRLPGVQVSTHVGAHTAASGHIPIAQHKGTQRAIPRCSGDGGTSSCPGGRPVPPSWARLAAPESRAERGCPPPPHAGLHSSHACTAVGTCRGRCCCLHVEACSHAEACVC